MSIADRARKYYKSQTSNNNIASRAKSYFAQKEEEEKERKRQEAEAHINKVIENRQSHHFDIIQNAYGQSRYGRVGNITADDYSAANEGSYDPRRQFVGRGGADAPSASMIQLGAIAPQKMKADLAWRQYNRYKDMERYGLVSGSEPIQTRQTAPSVRSAGRTMDIRRANEIANDKSLDNNFDSLDTSMLDYIGTKGSKLYTWFADNGTVEEKKQLWRVVKNAPELADVFWETNIQPRYNQYLSDAHQRIVDEAYDKAKSIEQDSGLSKVGREAWNAFWGGLTSAISDESVSSFVNKANMNRRAEEGKNNFGLEVLSGIGNMAPSLVASAINPALGTTVLFGQSYGQAKQQALSDGANEEDATFYGALVGTTEALLSRFLGGISAFAGKNNLGSTIGNAVTKAFSKVPRNVITKPLISLAVKTGKAIPEFIEEGLQSVISPALANITYGKEIDWENMPENVLHDGLIGAATAAVLNIAFSPVTRATRTASLTRADVENALPKPLAQAISQYEQSGSISDKAARRIEADLASQTALMALEPMEAIGITQGALDVIRATVAKIPKAKVVGASPTASVASVESKLANEQQNYDPDIDNIEDLSSVSKRARNAVRTVLNGKNIDAIQANQILSDPVALKKTEYILGVFLDKTANKTERKKQLMEAVKNYASYNVRKPTDTTGITTEAEQALMILQKNQRISHTNALKIANDPVASRVFNVLYGNELGKADTADTKAAKIVAVSKKLFYQDNAERMSAISDEARPIVEAFLNGEQISGKQADKIFADPVAVGVVEAYLGEPVSNQQPMSLKRKTLTQMSQSQENVSENPVVEKAVSSPVENWSTKRDNTNNQKKVYSLSEIVKAASKIFGVAPRVGALKDSTTPGEFNRQTGSIRLADDNDIPVLMHEFGHMMDRRLQIRENAPESVKSELVANFGRKDVYPQEKWLSEGIAEFARELITNPEAAQKKYPQSYRYLMSKLSPSMQKAIFETLAPAVNAYLSADLDSRALAATKADKDRIGVPWIVQHSETARKIYDWFNDNSFKEWWITHITDDLYGIDAASRKLGVDLTANYQLALNSRTSIRGRTMAAITKGLTDIDGNIIGRSFQSCFEPILEAVDGRHGGKRKIGEWTNDYNQTMNDFGLYLICCRGVDIRKSEDPNRSIFADHNLDSLEYMQSVVDKAPVEFKEAAKRIYEFFDKQIDMRVAAGTISEEEATAWRKAHPHWVPFERDVPGGKIDPTKPMTGSTKDFKGVFQAMAKITAQTITSTTQNTIRRDILQTITSLPDSAWFATRNPDADFTEVSPSNNSDNRPWEAYEHGKKEKTWDVGVYENGQRISYTINDKAFFTALSSLTPPTTRGVLRIFKSLNALFTSTVTGKNLPWNITSNAPRDFQTMGLSFEVGDLVEGLKNYVKSFATFDTENQSEDMRKFFILTSGGSELSSTLFRDEREINIRKKLMTSDLHGVDKAKARFLLGDIHPFGFISTVADYVETRSRIAAYLTARSNGKSHQEAIFESQDITTNFNRRGKWSKNINQFIPFFNAGVQGLSKSFRNYTGYKNAYESGSDRAKRAGAYVLKSTLFAVVASTLEAVAAMGLWNGDEEERKKAQDSWNRLSTYQKNNSWNIYIGDDTYISLKKPRELGILPSVVGRFAEAIVTENANTWYDFGSYAFENLLPPLLDVLPVMAEGVIAGEGWTNEFIGGAVSSFGFAGNIALALAGVDYRGNEIVPSSVSDRLPKEQYTEQTTTIAKALGAFLNMSPMQVDYALQNFGVLQNINEAFFTDENKSFMERLGGFLGGNSLIKKSTYSTDITSIFYDNRTYATQYANSYPDDIGAKVEVKEYNSMASFYSAFNNLQKNEPESEEKQTARRTVLDMLDQFNYEMENGYDKQVIDLMHNFSEDVVDWNKNARGENDTELSPTEFYPATMATVLGETKLNSEQYYVYQTAYLDAYYTLVAEAFASDTVSVPTMYKRIRKAKEKAKKQADNYMAEYLNLTGGK